MERGLGPEGQSPRDMRLRSGRLGALRHTGRAAPSRAPGGQRGLGLDRGLRAGGPDRCGVAASASAAAWSSSTARRAAPSHAPGGRGRRVSSVAFGPGAGSPRDVSSGSAAARFLRRASRAAPSRAPGGQRGLCQEHGLRARGPIAAGWASRRRRPRGSLPRPERLGPAPLKVEGGELSSMALGPGGQIAAGYGAAAAAA